MRTKLREKQLGSPTLGNHIFAKNYPKVLKLLILRDMYAEKTPNFFQKDWKKTVSLIRVRMLTKTQKTPKYEKKYL